MLEPQSTLVLLQTVAELAAALSLPKLLFALLDHRNQTSQHMFRCLEQRVGKCHTRKPAGLVWRLSVWELTILKHLHHAAYVEFETLLS